MYSCEASPLVPSIVPHCPMKDLGMVMNGVRVISECLIFKLSETILVGLL
jgi:hypothetical protein